ncbi:glycosyltransferase [Candidatus Ruminimicrobiellum ovillum]|uniref:glycosyltransferase n=1 Tax=Candidatus Ruminimicrobiellum ovillum TaxID=1947927 RepID=UPI003559846C
MPFSVLMSVYHKDNPQWLKQAIDSVLNNTIKPNQIVLVVDGQISNELEQVLTEYKDSLDILRLEKNSGLGIALQQGLLKCKYPLVARMDSDDISLPNRFEIQLKEFENNPNLTIVGGYIQEFDSQTNEKTSMRKVPLLDNKIKQYIKTRSPFNHPTVMFKKEDILKVGNYQTFYQMEDYYLWARLVKANYQMKNIPEILLNFRTDKNMFARRGSYKYFKSNKEVSKQMLKMKIISYPYYLFNISVRFITQVLMPNNIRTLFYKKVLR